MLVPHLELPLPARIPAALTSHHCPKVLCTSKASPGLSPSQRPAHQNHSSQESWLPSPLLSAVASPQPCPGHSCGLVLERSGASRKEPGIFLWFVKGTNFGHGQSYRLPRHVDGTPSPMCTHAFLLTFQTLPPQRPPPSSQLPQGQEEACHLGSFRGSASPQLSHHHSSLSSFSPQGPNWSY